MFESKILLSPVCISPLPLRLEPCKKISHLVIYHLSSVTESYQHSVKPDLRAEHIAKCWLSKGEVTVVILTRRIFYRS